jgi:hypothetical protein
MQVIKPPHNKYLLRNLDETSYIRYYHGYAKAKKASFRSAVGFLSGQGIVQIAFEISKGQVICYGKKRLGYAIVGAVSWLTGPLMPIITNSTKAIKVARFAHRTASEVMEISEDGCLAFLYAVDIMVFGQGVPVGDPGRFNIMDNCTDIFLGND